MDNKKTQKIAVEKFKERRMALNISQNDFAKVAKISYRTVLRFEQGKTVSSKSVDKIVHTLKMLESHPKNENLWWKSHKNSLSGKP